MKTLLLSLLVFCSFNSFSMKNETDLNYNQQSDVLNTEILGSILTADFDQSEFKNTSVAAEKTETILLAGRSGWYCYPYAGGRCYMRPGVRVYEGMPCNCQGWDGEVYWSYR